jgi:signal transduction histidine kinase
MKMQVRVQLVLATMAAIGCILIIVAARQVALQHLTIAITDAGHLESVVRHTRYQFRALLILFTVGSAVAGWLIGRHVMMPFERVKAALFAGTIGAGSHDAIDTWSADAHALKHAALRHESNLLRRTDELARETADLKQLLNAVSEGLLQIDSGTRVMQANPAALRLLGLPDHIIGQSLALLVRQNDLRNLIRMAADGETLFGAEATLDERRLLFSATPIPQEHEAVPPSAVIAIADLTQLRQLEGVRRDFVANVSHELKTPLTSIHGYSETLLADDDLPAETRRPFLEAIHRNALRLQRIVDDLLDLSRIESGAWHPDTQQVDVRGLINDVWLNYADTARRRGIEFMHLEHDLTVRADPHGLRQVFSNLFDNALRYTPSGGTIRVGVANSITKGDLVGIAVHDSGIGIPRDALGRIFERFYRVDPARSREDGGTGLGLSIVKHIVESMQGAVTADSDVGAGTTIAVWLPRS